MSPSRRIFANFLRLPDQYPITYNFYKNLLEGNHAFVLVKEFKVFNSWQEVLLGSDLSSEETWTVFDHPTIRLFAKTP